MRVTKIVKTYVTKAVNEKYAERIREAFRDYEAERKKINDFVRSVADEAEVTIQEFLKDLPDYRCYSGRVMHNHELNNPKRDMERSNLMYALNRERDQKIEDILVNLELGASKADLDEMLKNL